MATIREATIYDYDDVHLLQKQVHEIHVRARPDHYRMNEVTLDIPYYESLLKDETRKVFVAEVAGQIVAFSVISIKEAADSHLSSEQSLIHCSISKGFKN